MPIRVAVNGFGRIGRMVTRAGVVQDDFEFVAINDLSDPRSMAHLFEYDSLKGRFKGNVSYDDNHLIIDGHHILMCSEKDPAKLPWGELGVDIVIESTGRFRRRELLQSHLDAGATHILLTVPAKDAIDATVVMGVNEHILTGKETIISNASCTTNCLAPMAKVLHQNFGIVNGLMTTVHAYTNDQRILDQLHTDLRRARAAAMSIIPTSTGAAKAVGLIIPELEGKLNGMAMRVPIPDGSVTDLTVVLKREVSVEEINAAFKTEAFNGLRGILEYSEEELVSVDIIGNDHSCVFDSKLTQVNGNLAKVIGWYDNEWGYSHRVLDLVRLFYKKMGHPSLK